MREDLKLLDNLQEIDLQIEKLQAEKEEAFKTSPLSDFKKELASLKTKLEKLKQEEAKVSLQHKKAEGELELLEQKIASEEKRLYSGMVTNPKELKALNDEIASLERLKEKQEESFLEVEITLEGLNETIAHTEKSIKQKEKEVESEENRLKEIEENTLARVGELKSEVDKLREAIPPELLKIYDSRRLKLARRVVAHLKNGVCSGCQMEIHAEELDKILNNPDKLATCPNCQRLLLLLEE